MKKLNVYQSYIIVMFTLLFFSSCNPKENIEIEEINLTSALQTLKANFPDKFSELNLITGNTLNPNSIDENAINQDFILYNSKFNENEYFVEFNDEGYLVNQSNQKYEIQDAANAFSAKEIQLADLNNEFKSDITTQKGCGFRYALCGTACGAVSLGIAASDGPVPLMDVLAVAYMVNCTLECHDEYCQPEDEK